MYYNNLVVFKPLNLLARVVWTQNNKCKIVLSGYQSATITTDINNCEVVYDV